MKTMNTGIFAVAHAGLLQLAVVLGSCGTAAGVSECRPGSAPDCTCVLVSWLQIRQGGGAGVAVCVHCARGRAYTGHSG